MNIIFLMYFDVGNADERYTTCFCYGCDVSA